MVGLLCTSHCLVMCGAIVGALTVSLPPPIRKQKKELLTYLFAYNSGRILSYSLAGFLAGTFGKVLVRIFDMESHHSNVLMLTNGLFLVGIGLHIAGWLPSIALLEGLGGRLWRSLEPLSHALLPVTSLQRALVFGLVWGWFPCGLTYTVLLWAATGGDAVNGALAMAAFGVGTFPGILMASFLSGRLVQLRQSPWLKRGLGIAIILLAMVILAMDKQHSKNSISSPVVGQATTHSTLLK